MLIVDDVLLFPVKGLMFVFREIHNAARQEIENQEDALRAQLSELYMMLETRNITEEEFDVREKEILDRLESTLVWEACCLKEKSRNATA